MVEATSLHEEFRRNLIKRLQAANNRFLTGSNFQYQYFLQLVAIAALIWATFCKIYKKFSLFLGIDEMVTGDIVDGSLKNIEDPSVDHLVQQNFNLMFGDAFRQTRCRKKASNNALRFFYGLFSPFLYFQVFIMSLSSQKFYLNIKILYFQFLC